MADYWQVVEDVKALILSNRGGLPINKLSRDYEIVTGEKTLPYLSLGFTSLYHFVRSLESIIGTRRNAKNEVVYYIKNRKNEGLSKDRRRENPTSRYETSFDSGCSSVPSRQSWNSGSSCSRISGSTSSRISECSRKIQFARRDTRVYKPIVKNAQMIGDDFFLQLVFRNTNYNVSREKTNGPLYCGLCESGQTINSCRLRLRKTASLSNKLIIMLGAEDIYQGRKGSEIISSYKKLLSELQNEFGLRRSSITICSIPPLLNRCIFSYPEQSSALYSVNSWLAGLQEDGYGFIDIFDNLTFDQKSPDYQFFQNQARNVSGTRCPYVLFNLAGRERIMALLENEL